MALVDYITNKPIIKTDRLTLRPICKNDIPDLREWMSDESLYTYWGKKPSKSEKNPELLFEKTEKPTKKLPPWNRRIHFRESGR